LWVLLVIRPLDPHDPYLDDFMKWAFHNPMGPQTPVDDPWWHCAAWRKGDPSGMKLVAMKEAGLLDPYGGWEPFDGAQ
jgi:hypothetical protein